MRVRLLTAFIFVVALSACFSAKPPATSPSATPSPSTGVAPSIFPHKAGWKDATQHGIYVKDVLSLDATTCLGCHKETDAVSGGAPSCRSCHSTFPHVAPGVTQATHGDYVLKNGKSACATQCHGTNLLGGLSGVACTKCHATYPHTDAWSTPGKHGPAAEGTLKNNCVGCHGKDWNGGDSKVSCVNCHKGSYPHPEGWASPEQHGAFASKNGTGKCATQCHGVQLDGGLSGVSCKTCHTIWPHPTTGWLAQHGQTARTIGLSGCMGCHKNDATGGKTGVTCTQCHTSLPAHQDTAWGKAGHGKLVMQQPTTLTDPKGCPLCHGAKLEGGKVPTLPGLKTVQGCNDCHASYPTLHQPAAGSPAWNTYNGHAKWVLNQVDAKGDVLNQLNTLIADCKLCHGDDLKGGSSGKSCAVSGCHTNFPHNTDPATTPWLTQHGAIASAETPKAASCATANCHGQKLEGSSFNGKKLVMACTDCHLQMPHQATWLKTHGASAATKLSDCTQCHGDNLQGKGTSPSCYKCHGSYPLPHRYLDGTKNPQWAPAIGADFHGTLVMGAPGTTAKDKATALKCGTCHDSGNNGNPSPSCYTCHPSTPHAPAPLTVGGITYTFTDTAWDGLKGLANSHGQYVVARAKLNAVAESQQVQTECGTTCHGTDFKGGNSKKSCLTCHHSTNETAWAAKDHGAAAIKNVNGCKSCHGPDLKGTAIATSCATCHGPGTKATLSSHQDVQTGTASVCIEENDMEECIAWEDKPVFDYFVPKLHREAAVKDLAVCKTCHGDDFKGGISQKSCFSCHNPGGKYPHTKLGPNTISTWKDQIATKTVPAIATLQPGSMDKNCYTACHGTFISVKGNTIGSKGIVRKADGTSVFPDLGDCWGCHKNP